MASLSLISMSCLGASQALLPLPSHPCTGPPPPLSACSTLSAPPCSLFPKPISRCHPLPIRTKHKARSSFILFICGAKAEVGWETTGRSSFPSQRAVVCSEHSWLLGTVGWVSGASPVSLGAPSFMWGLWPLHCPVVSFGKGSPTWWYHLFFFFFLVSPESRGP